MGLFELITRWQADRKVRKLLRGAPRRSLTELSENRFAKLVGRVQPHRGRVLEAPLSGRLCAYYSIEVLGTMRRPRAFVRPGDGEHHQRHVVASEDEAVPFELEVDGQRAVIDPADAWISSGFDHRHAGATGKRARALCVRLGLDRVSFDWARLIFHEAILGIGERIALFGVREPDRDRGAGEHGYRADAPTRFRFTGSASSADHTQDLHRREGAAVARAQALAVKLLGGLRRDSPVARYARASAITACSRSTSMSVTPSAASA